MKIELVRFKDGKYGVMVGSAWGTKRFVGLGDTDYSWTSPRPVCRGTREAAERVMLAIDPSYEVVK